jgi:hypothetical protein
MCCAKYKSAVMCIKVRSGCCKGIQYWQSLAETSITGRKEIEPSSAAA